jgi:hypothetical protein
VDNGSDRVALGDGPPDRRPGDEPAGRPDPGEPITVTVYLRMRPEGGDHASESVSLGQPPPETAEAVMEYVRGCGLTVEPSLAPEAIRLSGPVSAVERCFGVRLTRWHTAEGGQALVPDGPVYLPRSLVSEVVAVLGLDTRPIAQRHE